MKNIPVSENGQISNQAAANSFRAKIEEIFLRAVRLYTFNTPVAKGKFRLCLSAMNLCRHLPTEIEVGAKDGRRFSVNLTTGMNIGVFFFGEYDKALTDIVSSLLREGDVCLDVGANFGWYTTLFHKHCGAKGAVHAFEPVPATFRQLRRNYQLMGEPKNVFLNNLAVGDRRDRITINLFENEPTGHASLSAEGHTGDAVSFECEMITLDSYLEERSLGDVNFVKVDIEGAELIFLKGAEKLFRQKVPPIFLIEMALATSKPFGYLPNDLINFIRERAAYDFYAVEEIEGKLKKIEGFAPEDIGANVICIPRVFYADRFESIRNNVKL